MIQVHRNIDQLPAFTKAVITIGTFDGVHLGHQQIIDQLKVEAEQTGGETVIITFHPHPRKIVTGNKAVPLLNTLAEKTELLQMKGVQHLVVVPFNEAFAAQTPEEYISHFLVKKFRPSTIIIGYDHRFGKGRLGDYHLLEKMGSVYDYQVKEIPEHILNESIISSTKIREALLNSQAELANRYLGYTYFFEGKVVKGNQLGRTIGYPTANIALDESEKLVPGNGVYAVEVSVYKNIPHVKGMMNIGVRPTVDGSNRVIEVHLFDFDEDIYDVHIRVYIRSFIRGEQKFTGLDALKEQLAHDRVAALSALDRP